MKKTEGIKSKKIKNIVITLLEIFVIAAVIMAVLLTVQSKLKDRSSSGVGIEKKNEEKQQEIKEEVIDEYYLEVNIKKAALIVYQYNKDKTNKSPIKVMAASIGKDVKADKYKLKETYTWLNSENDVWNKYNYRYSTTGWIQSVNYSDKYSWTLDRDSYKALGERQSEDKNIKLLAGDAHWIYTNCGEGTALKVVKGSKDDVLPMEIAELKTVYKTCGWDPTDPEKGNPYSSITNGTVSNYEGTVYVEKGSEVKYTSNLLALDEAGNNITKKLKYEEFSSSEMGTHKVKYKYTTEAGTKLEATIVYEVIDTTVPVVTLSKTNFTYEVDSKKEKDLNTKKVKSDIEQMVKKSASASEGTITAMTVPKEQLKIGINYVHVVAKDSAGNIGQAQAIVEIKVKEKETKKSDKKKKEEETTKKKKKKKDTEESIAEAGTTVAIETTKPEETTITQPAGEVEATQ